MTVTRLEILSYSDYENGQPFADTGAYERIEAIAHYAVDPGGIGESRITDLALAETGPDGRVVFSGDVTLLRPKDADRGNRALLVQVPNRGGRQLARFNQSDLAATGSPEIDAGDGFLMRHGWTIAWVGWQWDVPRDAARTRIGLNAPELPRTARREDLQAQLRFQPNKAELSLPLTDQHVGVLGNHALNRTADVNDASACLIVHDGLYGEPEVLPRAKWQFAKADGDAPVPDDGHILLDGGFQPGRIYDLFYTPLYCPVVGAGLLAMRDCASFLRYDAQSPLAGSIQHVIGEGQSQCGRFLRTFLYNGMNSDTAGRPAFDGVLAHIAGGRRGEFNHRYAQPSVQTTPSIGHLFPFADEAQTDPLTGRQDGLLNRQKAVGNLPKIFYTDTSAEYWRGDAALAHSDLESGGDAAMPDRVRRYLFTATQHGPGAVRLTDATLFGSRGGNPLNIVDYRPLYRAALMNLLAWVATESEPPPSAYPTAGKSHTRAEILTALSQIPALALPVPAQLNYLAPLDLGENADRGIVKLPAVMAPIRYPDLVSAVDGDGNETAGIPMPDVSVPVATHTGFNPRHPETGGAGQILDYVGSSLPFARDAAARAARNDPRPSLAERYADRGDYLSKVQKAAEELVQRRYLLAEDVPLCLALAEVRYESCIAWQAD